LPADVLDDLAERGEPVVGVGERGARFDAQPEAPVVVLGEGGQALVEPEALAEPARHQRA
jgi:hypothetical protein